MHQRKGLSIGEVDDNSVDIKVKEVRYQQEQANKPAKDKKGQMDLLQLNSE